jgi:hypothetical protein
MIIIDSDRSSDLGISDVVLIWSLENYSNHHQKMIYVRDCKGGEHCNYLSAYVDLFPWLLMFANLALLAIMVSSA